MLGDEAVSSSNTTETSQYKHIMFFFYRKSETIPQHLFVPVPMLVGSSRYTAIVTRTSEALRDLKICILHVSLQKHRKKTCLVTQLPCTCHSYCVCSMLQLQHEFWWIVGWPTIIIHVWQKRHNLTIYTVWVEIRRFEICKNIGKTIQP